MEGTIDAAEVPERSGERRLRWRRLGSPLRDVRSAALLVGLLAALVYANSLQNGFAYDDGAIIVDNPAIQSLETLPGAVLSPYWPGTGGENASLWRPVTTAVLGLQYVLGGGGPLLFHVTNVLLHALATVGVLVLLTHLLSLPAALLAAVVFAVHPVHVEAVANVVGFAEIFSTTALLAALILHVRGPDRSGWRRSLIIGALYALGFGAKESAVTLPGLVFLVDAARGRLAPSDLPAYLRARWRVYLVMLLVAAGLLAARLPILGVIASPTGPMGAEILSEIPRIWTLATLWTHYVRLWVFPLDLSIDYTPNVIPIAFGWNATNLVGLLLALAVLVGALVAWRRPPLGKGSGSARAAGFGVVWFLVAISPVSNTLFLTGVLLAERTLYLPSVGLAAATGWFLARLWRRRKRVGMAVIAATVILAGMRTWLRNPTWASSYTVFVTMMREQPHGGRSQWMLGDTFWEQGDVPRALAAYRHTISLFGGHYGLLAAVAQRLMDIDAYGPAEHLLQRALAEDPTRAPAPRILALVRAELGDAAGAERYARLALAIEEWDPIRHHLLAWALASRGAWDEAARARATADEQARGLIWQQWMYQAHDARRRGDTAHVRLAVDSAYANVRSETGRASLDVILAREFPEIPGAAEGAARPPGPPAVRAP